MCLQAVLALLGWRAGGGWGEESFCHCVEAIQLLKSAVTTTTAYKLHCPLSFVGEGESGVQSHSDSGDVGSNPVIPQSTKRAFLCSGMSV
jgi:hypothetical protein